jgi:RNA polymerase sigma-70 factor, ECF subfamily
MHDMHELDRDLARRMTAGRDDAFRRFFDEYFPRVYRFCTRRVTEDAAEEVTQTVMINAVRKISRYRGEASLFTWLCQIARHEISAHYRRQSRHTEVFLVEDQEAVRAELESLAADPDLAPDRLVAHGQGQAVVQLILDHLPGDYGRVLEWKYMEGYSVDEIAGRLSTTPVAVQSTLARARRAFRQQYAAMVGDEAALLSGAGPEGS